MDSSSYHVGHRGSNVGISTYGSQNNIHDSTITFTSSGGGYPNEDNHDLRTSYMKESDYEDNLANMDSRHDGTCEWVLNTPEFRSWSQDKSTTVLYVVGCPGVGKTVLAKFLVGYLGEERTIYFFCGRRENPSTAESILDGLIYQCVGKVDRIFKTHVEKSYHRLGQKLRRSFRDLCIIFRNIMSDAQFGNWCCVLEALDECNEDERKRLLDMISENMSTNIDASSVGPNHMRWKLLLTSRPCWKIKSKLSRLSGSESLDFNDSNGTAKNKSDMEKFIVDGIQGLPFYSEDLQTSLRKGLIARADGNFRWVSCMLEAFEKTTIRDEGRLWHLPLPGMDAMFSGLLNGLEPELMCFIEWIALAYRQLSVTELSLAVHINPYETSKARRMVNGEHAKQLNIALLKGAVKVRQGKQTEDVYLSHHTMKDYLEAHGQELHFDCQEIHLKLARACLFYLRSDELKRGPLGSYEKKEKCRDDYRELLATLPFLDYAARHWSRHLRDAGLSNSDICKQIYESLATTENRQLSFQVLRFSDHKNYVGGMSCLHVLAYHDLGFLKKGYFENLILRCITAPGSGQNAINATDAKGRTALWLAAKKARKVMAEILLRFHADANLMDRDRGMSPLLVAAENGCLEIVDVLLQNNNVDRGSKDCDGRNVLSLAAAQGHVEVVTLLLRHEEIKSTKDDPDGQNENGQTPLLWAARKGHRGCTEVLLSHGANPNVWDRRHRRSALSWAAGNEKADIVELLLSHEDTNLLLKDREGWTAFRVAACPDEGKPPSELACKIAMEILDKLSVRYRSSWAEVSTSLLIEASKIGEVRQLDILLQRPDIHPNSRDADGCTALSWSARKGHEKFVERLLGDGRVDVNLKDNLGRTALMWAASEGRGEATKLLLDCPGIDINGKDVQGKTALQLADNNGHGARFQQLMKERRAGHSRT
ncbi:hypothetical protein LTR67_009991 [Exophiala xenobiotica]